MPAVGVLSGWLIVGLVGALATVRWSRRVWRRRAELPVGTRLIAAIVAAAALVGTIGTVLGLVKVFGAFGGDSVHPSQKARMLAEGISEAMNCTAFGIIVWLPSAIILLFLMRKLSDRSE